MKYYEVNFTLHAPEVLLQDARDIVSALAGEAGFETFTDTDEGLTGYVQQSLFDRQLLDQMLETFPMEDTTITYEVCEAEDKDWNEAWEEAGFDPIVISDKCIIHDGRHLNGMIPADYKTAIEIHARQAFGTGTHETTRMVASVLLSLDLEGRSVLDCGTGTGILAILSLLSGAKEAVGYDIDEWSTANAQLNAELNNVDSRMKVYLGNSDLLGDSIQGPFDVVVANINRNILIADLPRFISQLAPGGHIVLSGFYECDVPLLTQQLSSLGVMEIHTLADNEWACINGVRR